MLSTVLDLAAVGLAAEQVGGAQKVLEMAVEYAKVRVQFGRPIGSFQAIKHKCADMLLEVESAKSAAYYAGVVRRRDQRRAAVGRVRWPRRTARRRTSTPPPRTSRSTAASASPGSTPRTCTSSGPSSSELLLRRPDLPPRAARPAHRHLIDLRRAALRAPEGTPMLWVFVAVLPS